MFDRDEFERWTAQASDTLVSSRNDLSMKSYNWCCFKAQQAAEYAVKGLLKGLGVSAYGHSIIKLLNFEYFDEKTALDALNCAEKICDFCTIIGKKYE